MPRTTRGLRALAIGVIAIIGLGGPVRAAEPADAATLPPGVSMPPARDAAPPPPPSDWPFSPPPGWFADVQVDVARPTGEYRGTTPWSWTAAPQIEAGYRFGAGNAVRLGYEFLYASGDATSGITYYGDEHVHSSTELDVMRLDYVSCEHPWLRYLRFREEAGFHVDHLNVDVRTAGPFSTTRDASDFWGAGLHGGVTGSIWLGETGLELFGRLVVGGGLGATRYSNSYTPVGTPDFPAGPGYADNSSATHLELDGLFQLGVAWTLPACRPWLRVAAGLQGEAWYNGAIIGGDELDTLGVFVRGEFQF